MPDPVEDGVTTSNLVQDVPMRFVLVTGAARSGTSTAAGSLNYLGLHVPRPVLGANRSNPRGFFEPRWAITFHRQILDRAGVDMWDGRPEGWAKVQDAIRSEDRQKIAEWLRAAARQAPQVVVKDPRSAWVPRLWAEAAQSVGFAAGYLTMLRHPAEVVGSRTTYYAKGDAAAVRNYQVTNIARWVNTNLMTERQTRGEPRVFLRYFDLVGDWRKSMSVVGQDLGLVFNADIESGEPHPVDDFVDPELRRHAVQWQDLEIPDELQAIAEEIWLACAAIADNHGVHQKAQAAMDGLSERYESLFRDASAISHDAAAAAANAARRKAVRQTRAKMRKAQQSHRGLQRATKTRAAMDLVSRAAAAVRGRIGAGR